MIELKHNNSTPYLDRYTTDISAKVMSDPEKYHAYERESITRRIMVSLMKKIQNAPLLVGLPGVGKTAIVEDLARQLIDTKVASLQGKHLIQISLANLMKSSDGESFAHKFQAIIDELIVNKDTVIAFIDEIHQIVGTGAETSGSSLDAGNIIKPALSRDDLQIIGATTTKEFHEYVARDGALMRRFDLIEVPELSFEQTKRVLSKVALQLNNGIEVPKTVQDRIMALSQRYITDRYFPEKAIMLLDGALSVARLDNHPTLSNQDVATIIHDDYHVPEADDLKVFKYVDTLPKEVDYKSAKVYSKDGKTDLTKYFKISYDEKTRVLTAEANADFLKLANADKTKAFALPVVDVYVTANKDNATIKNTYDIWENASKTESNTVENKTPGVTPTPNPDTPATPNTSYGEAPKGWLYGAIAAIVLAGATFGFRKPIKKWFHK